MRFASFLCVLLWSSSALLGCACDGRTPRRDGGTAVEGGTSTTETGSQCGDGMDNDGDGLRDCADPDCAAEVRCMGFDGGMRIDTGFDECSGMDFVAETRNAPVDIVWVIDNSGSMNEEASEVQRRLNDFVGAIGTAGITDYRVVVVTQSGFVSVPPPLGTDAEHYLFVDTNVQSSDSFDRALEQVPMYSGFLRADATTHFIFVTDDESSMSSATFVDRMTAALGHAFVGHAIASPPGSTHILCPFPGVCLPMMNGCTGPGGEAADNGQQYWLLADRTGGLHLSICTSDWGILFTELLNQVAIPRPIPCSFNIPEPAAGMMFDPNLVNVVYTPTGSGPVTIPRATSNDCSGAGNNWVYDDPAMPTQILLCGSICSTVEADATGAVRIQLGCETILD